jgi:DNA-binding PadR family transcriptional regulator
MRPQFHAEMRERVIRNFIDLLILKELKENGNRSGYDIIDLFHKKFHLILSPGSVYSMLYAMERMSLVAGATAGGKRLYKLTRRGEEKIENILCSLEEIHFFIDSMFER